MKNYLLASTGLAVAGLLAWPAAAQLEITIGGEVQFLAGWSDIEDDDVFDFKSNSEVVVRANGTADNGLQYGAKIELSTSTNDESNSDEVSLFVGGSWGRLEFGDFDGAADEMAVYAPTVGNGQVDGDFLDFALGANIGLPFKPFDSSDSTKINYYTPRFAGFRLGVAYAPYFDQGESVVTGSELEDFIEAGVDYTNQFGSFGLLAAVTYTTVDAPGFDTFDGWSAGAQVSFGGFTVGGGYMTSEILDFTAIIDEEHDVWNAGVTYELGPWGFGAQYYNIELDSGGETDVIGAGAVYTLAPGLTLASDVVYVDGDGEDAWVVLGEIKAAF